MALTDYTELQAAIRTETNISTGQLADAVIVDAITRAESKINRKIKCRNQRTLATDTLGSSSRLVDAPTGMLEWIDVKVKLATDSDDNYESAISVTPDRIADFYGKSVSPFRFTLRAAFEFNRAPDSNHTVQFDYVKAWDIATDDTNWLLTTFPDAYLYGALVECELHVKNDPRVVVWKTMFEEALNEIERLEDRNRDDMMLDVSDLYRLGNSSSYNILTGD